MLKALGAALIGWGIMMAGAPAAAQAWPAQPIKLVVPWPPGGGVDTSARIIVQALSQRLGQPIVVENKPGAGGNIGTEQVARARPDGYTLLMGSVSPNAINVHLYSRLGFDAAKDFSAITLVASVPNILVVPAKSPANNVADLLRIARAKPGSVNYASGGVGSSQHLAGELFKSMARLELVHVPYKGTSPAEVGLMAGEVDMMIDTTAALPLIASGKLKALAVAAKTRLAALPDVPTLDEAGVSNVYAGAWYGVMGPAGLPREIVDRISREINAVLQTPEIIKRMEEFGATIGGGTPESFHQFVLSEIARYADIVKLAGAKVE